MVCGRENKSIFRFWHRLVAYRRWLLVRYKDGYGRPVLRLTRTHEVLGRYAESLLEVDHLRYEHQLEQLCGCCVGK